MRPLLVVELGSMFPDELSLGMEIRTKVTEYVKARINVLRQYVSTLSSTKTTPLSYVFSAMKRIIHSDVALGKPKAAIRILLFSV